MCYIVASKLDYLLNNLVENLNCNNYNIFGATVFQIKWFISIYRIIFLNKTGIFSNLNDNVKDLEKFCNKYPSQFYLHEMY